MKPAALVLALLCAMAAELSLALPQRVRLIPQLTPGQSLRYQMDLRTLREGTAEGPVADPHAPAWSETSVAALVRLDVLEVSPTAGGAGFRSARLRVHYEKLSSTTRSELAAPGAAEETENHPLEGRALEFTLEGAGGVRDLILPDDLDPEMQSAVRQWLTQLSLAVPHPAEGITPGQKWRGETPKSLAAPLVGLRWRTESTYLGNEPCRPAALAAEGTAPVAAVEICAAILTRLETVQDSPRDPTPPEFRERGLRTAGTVSGTGESLSYVSLTSGLVVSVTQSSEQYVDLTVATEDGSSQVRYRYRLRSSAQITLLPPAR